MASELDDQLAAMNPIVRKYAERMQRDIDNIFRTLVEKTEAFGAVGERRDPKSHAKKVAPAVVEALRLAWLAGSEYESQELNAELDRLGGAK